MRIIIIGSGPGGYETALEAASRGLEVLLVTQGPLGGTCLNEGCIPTKFMCSIPSPDPSRKDAIVAKLSQGIASMLKHPLITLIQGTASFVDARTVKVGESCYSADRIIIASGSLPASLPVSGASLCSTSSDILNLDSVPGSLCVIGGGVIGLEFASIFRRFGSEVTVIEYCPEVLPRFDRDLSKHLKSYLVRRGIRIETSAKVLSVDKRDTLRVEYEKNGISHLLDAEIVLMAVGRRPNIDSLSLDRAGISHSPKGIPVDSNMQADVPGIYAVGDVTGGMMLAHVASFQGLRALNHICGLKDSIDFSLVPATVFTEPELASVGRTEEQCVAEGICFKVHKSFYRANGKALVMGESDGYCKIIESDGQIIGAHILGAHASDLIHEFVVMMNLSLTIDRARCIIHAHPTLSELVLSALKN